MALSSSKQQSDDNSTYNTVQIQPMDDRSSTFFYVAILVLTVQTFVTNGAVVIFMFSNRSRSSTSFYRLMCVYVIINFVNSGVTLLAIIVLNSEQVQRSLQLQSLGIHYSPLPPPKPSNGPGGPPMRKGDRRIDIMADVGVVRDIFACVYTSIVLFLIGLNRFGIFVWSPIEKYIFGKTGFRIVNLLMLIAATAISVSMCLIGMMKRKFDEDTGTMSSGMNEAAGYTMEIFYVIPIFSFGFYLAVIISLRQKRSLVKSEKTNVLLNKTENITLKIGIEILTVYSLALIFHELCRLAPTNLENYFMETERIIATIPQLAVPIIFVTSVSEFRSFLTNTIYCKANKMNKNGKVDITISLKSKQNNSKSTQNEKSNDTKRGSRTFSNLPATDPHSIHSAKHSQR
ncbi:hypothetical protein WR25_06584 [Diploscapter pachys]|uniref:G-protein coupled receptors family 1 profile domain-containing protein n=1 Tax=Diploscapter pachys TaxID=2018661 RepID=A0A2A2L0T8_9BILA|nr:hypothetical protein WR25_06584 [Diploscapter pachys]